MWTDTPFQRKSRRLDIRSPQILVIVNDEVRRPVVVECQDRSTTRGRTRAGYRLRFDGNPCVKYRTRRLNGMLWNRRISDSIFVVRESRSRTNSFVGAGLFRFQRGIVNRTIRYLIPDGLRSIQVCAAYCDSPKTYGVHVKALTARWPKTSDHVRYIYIYIYIHRETVQAFKVSPYYSAKLPVLALPTLFDTIPSTAQNQHHQLPCNTRFSSFQLCSIMIATRGTANQSTGEVAGVY